jgi:hypothetical protein
MPAVSSRHGVTSQSRSEPKNSLDDFPTPPWATRAFIAHVLSSYAARSDLALEPTCNRGYMARPLAEYFETVLTSDIAFYGWTGQQQVRDFLESPSPGFDWLVTNPPYKTALNFIEQGLHLARKGVAVIVRGAFPEGQERYRRLFSKNPPTVIAYYAERVSMVKGCYNPDASHAIQYMWMLWVKGVKPQPPVWIPPCKARLTRPDDVRWQT